MKRRKRRGGGERFVKLPHWMLKCPAWRTLSPNAKAVLLHLWEEHNGSNNGEIVYAVRSSANIDRRHLTDGQKRDLVHEAEDEDIGIGISKDQTARALTELTRRGVPPGCAELRVHIEDERGASVDIDRRAGR